MTWSRTLGAVALAAALGWLFAGAAAAEEAEKIPVKVLVTHVSSEGSNVPEEARGLHEALVRNQISGVSNVKVIHKSRPVLEIDEVHRIPLPGGRKARIRPISRRANSVLMAVDVERSVKLDARVRRHKPFIIRAGKHNGGNLVIQLELDD